MWGNKPLVIFFLFIIYEMIIHPLAYFLHARHIVVCISIVFVTVLSEKLRIPGFEVKGMVHNVLFGRVFEALI